MTAYGGMDALIHILLTLALAGDEWSASIPDRFTPGTHWIWRLSGPQSLFGRHEEEKILDPTGTQTPTP
jgi:hypothetical protein